MSREFITVLWVLDGAPSERPVVGPKARLIEVPESGLEAALQAAHTRGGVLVLCAPDKVCGLLQRGADEANSWDCGLARFEDAVRRAHARAIWRAAYEREASEELPGLALLSAAMGHQLGNPLTAALLNCHVLQSALPVQVGLPETTESATGASDIPPSDLPPQDIRGALDDLGIALRDIATVVDRVMSLSQDDDVKTCDLSRVLVELAASVHANVERVADFVVEVPDRTCAVALSRTVAMEIVASLLSNAVCAVERSTQRPGAVTLRLSCEEGSVVVEVSDNGVGMNSQTRLRAVNPLYTLRRPGSLGMGLTFAALHARRAGGELLIDSELGHGTSVRMFLPWIGQELGSLELPN